MLFTDQFPHGDGEQFIESELGFLSSQFEQVILVPFSTAPKRLRAAGHDNVVVLDAPHRDRRAAAVVRHVLRHPWAAGRAIAHSLLASTNVQGKKSELVFRLLSQIRASEIAPRLTELISPSNGVVLYSYWLHLPAGVAVETRRLLRRPEVAIVSRAHGYDIYEDRSEIGYLPARKHLLSLVGEVHCDSQRGAEHLRQSWPSYRNKVHIAHLGVEAATNPRNACREAGTVVTLSFIRPVKRLNLLIAALAALHLRGVRVRWVHIGADDSEHSTHLQDLARRTLDPDHVEFIGTLSNEDVRAWFARHGASVFVNVSSSEGVPVSIMEALAQGLPIIATDVGGNSETIDLAGGMFDGLLPPNPEPDAIAKRIESLLCSTDAEYRGYVDASYDHWAREWSAHENLRAFASLLARHAAPARRSRNAALE